MLYHKYCNKCPPPTAREGGYTEQFGLGGTLSSGGTLMFWAMKIDQNVHFPSKKAVFSLGGGVHLGGVSPPPGGGASLIQGGHLSQYLW